MKYLLTGAIIIWGVFFYTNAKAHEEWITKKDTDTQILLHDMTMDIIQIIFSNMPDILDSIEKELRDREDKRYKCWLQPKEYKNKDCPPKHMQPMTSETD
tara:strand:+ start:336 stop:635 length:300 start_codon:yes stop_codon:yes gene_type:complete